MSDPVECLILDLLESVEREPRPYPEVLDAWKTSCPRLPVWEEACSRGYLESTQTPGRPPTLALSAAGRAHLSRQRRK